MRRNNFLACCDEVEGIGIHTSGRHGDKSNFNFFEKVLKWLCDINNIK